MENKKEIATIIANQSAISNGINSTILLILLLSVIGSVCSNLLISGGIQVYSFVNNIYLFMLAICCIIMVFKVNRSSIVFKVAKERLKRLDN